jgi:hypothetical protein
MKLETLKALASELDTQEMKGSDPYSDDCVEDALETLVKAERIKQDVKLMALVQKEIRAQKKAISSIQDIKDRYVEVTIKAPDEEILTDEGDVTAVKRVKDDGEDEDE